MTACPLRTDIYRLAACLVAVGLIGGCGMVGLFQEDCAVPYIPPSDEPLDPIPLALRYLSETQLTSDQLLSRQRDYAGDWPQCLAFDREGPFIRDASPFMATFIHHALALITEQHGPTLGLSEIDIAAARRMRVAAVELMSRFQADPGDPDAGTFGFWPRDQRRWFPGDALLATIGVLRGQGPRFAGVRAPVNVSFYPAEFFIPSDADDTAAIYAVLLDHARLDSGPEVIVPFEQFFADWRDLGQVPRRNDAPWLPTPSGAYLTWLAYPSDPAGVKPNDVDIVVNANVLYALGRYGQLDTPGVSEAISLINGAMRDGAHLSDPRGLSLYYPDNLALHYCVTRAYREGGVTALAPAVDLLVEDLRETVETDDSGHIYWDRGDPHLNTAFGVLALLNAGRYDDLVERGVSYHLSRQHPVDGSWEAGAFFGGRLDDGTKVVWYSPALTTAMALEALCRHRLQTSDVFPRGPTTSSVRDRG